jgi:hypothetical protein
VLEQWQAGWVAKVAEVGTMTMMRLNRLKGKVKRMMMMSYCEKVAEGC